MKKFIKKYKNIIVVIISLVIFYLIIPLPDNIFNSDYSTIITDKNGEILRAFVNTEEQWRFPPNYGKYFSNKLHIAVINFEDRYFHYHPGVNPISIGRALLGNIISGKIKSGASTISMQIIRLAFKKKRTLLNKLIEMFQALKLEIKYSKKEILRMYLKNAPYGGNIIGVDAASLRYFGKLPKILTWNEAAILAVLPNSPGLISPLQNREKLIKKKNRLLKKLFERRIIDHDIYNHSISESVPSEIIPFPVIAPHFSEYLKKLYRGRRNLIKSSINKELQIRSENLIKEHLKILETSGINNGAVIVAETKSGKVRSYCGSQDFFNYENSGQVDGVIAPRSSGSILKPFLYALAIDEGYILEKTVIKDIPSYFGSFSPSNASKTFCGVVTAKEALIKSLNVPAVRLLNYYGLHKFYIFLKKCGLTTLIRPPDEYGLTIILGGAETKLIELVQLYRGLGNYGKFSSLVFNEETVKAGKKKELISPEASYLTLDMLKELKRPGAEYYWEQYRSKTPIGWKTGTSYGKRDAWAVGVSPEWTIGVWIGNFSGEGNRELAGYSCAAPLMFDVFNYLPKNSSYRWFKKQNLKFKKVELCVKTGFLANENCNETVKVNAPSGQGTVKLCPYHSSVYVSLDEKESVCSLCWEEGRYKRIKKLIFPPDVAQFLREKGDIVDSIPPHNKKCTSVTESNPLQILYPVQNAKILIPVDFNGKIQNLTIKIAHRFKNRKVFWYIDGIYKGVTKNRHKMVINMLSGWHELEVIDQNANSAKRNFFVSFTKSSR